MSPMRNRIAEGGYLLAGSAAVKAERLAGSLSKKLLQKAAYSDGNGGDLLFPDEAEESLEYRAKQIKERLSNIAEFVPQFLAERGFLKKKCRSIEAKLDGEYRLYLKKIKRLDKDEIIVMAGEIARKQALLTLFSDGKTAPENLGLLMCIPNLLDQLAEQLENNGGDFSGAIDSMVVSLSNEHLNECLTPFCLELEAAKKRKYNTVTFTIHMSSSKSPNKQITMTMPLCSFLKYLDTELINNFSIDKMTDFPTRCHFGVGGEEIYDSILEKRFLANFEKNYMRYAKNEIPGYGIVINAVLKEAFLENSYDGVRNRYHLKEYIEACYKQPTLPLMRIAKFFAEHCKIIDDVQKMIK